MRSRVIPGSLVTMARRVPVKRLKSVDLPTLGRPTMTSDGRRSGISSRAGRTTDAAARRAIFQCSAFPVVQIEEPICLGCARSEEDTSELQSLTKLVCRLLLAKKTH